MLEGRDIDGGETSNDRLHCIREDTNAGIDFENETYEVQVNSSAEIPWDSTGTAALTLTNMVAANNTHPMFLALGIEFYQFINGNMYPLRNGAFNPLSIVQVSGV